MRSARGARRNLPTSHSRRTAMAEMKAKRRGGSQPPKPATINRRSAPRSGKSARVHPLNRGFPTSFRKASSRVKVTNPNAATRQRLDKFFSIAHAHTSVATPIKAYPTNDRGRSKRIRSTRIQRTKTTPRPSCANSLVGDHLADRTTNHGGQEAKSIPE
jgi:hypothetical protein